MCSSFEVAELEALQSEAIEAWLVIQMLVCKRSPDLSRGRLAQFREELSEVIIPPFAFMRSLRFSGFWGIHH